MKLKYIIGIAVFGIALAVIITSAGDASNYVDFEEAKKLSEKGYKGSVHLVGKLLRDGENNILGVEPSPDKLTAKFKMMDESSNVRTVYYNNPLPNDLKQSEQIVVVGNYKNQEFVAEKILLKCPSKYQEEPSFNQ